MALPGDCDAYVFTLRAISRNDHLDFVDGTDILFHAKPLQGFGWVVINSFLGGAWQQETHVLLEPEAFEAPIRLQLALDEAGLQVQVNDLPPVPYPLELSRLAQARLRHGSGIQAVRPEAAPAAPVRLSGRILTADIMHLQAEATLPGGDWTAQAVREDAAFLATIDGRPAGRMPVASLLRDAEGGPLALRFDFGRGVFASDGMDAALLLERGAEREVLASAPLQSSFAGGIDRCNEAMVRGFAANPKLPGRPVMVDVYINDVFQGTTRADRPRTDLERFGPAYARAGFEFTFARPIHLPLSADAWVSVRVRDTDLDLANSPWWVSRAVRRDSLLAASAG